MPLLAVKQIFSTSQRVHALAEWAAPTDARSGKTEVIMAEANPHDKWEGLAASAFAQCSAFAP
jgi:hypothetical protein